MKKKKNKSIIYYITPYILPVLFIIAWHIASIIIDKKFVLPKIATVIGILLNPTAELIGIGSLIGNVSISFLRVLIGYFLAIIIAVPLGMMIGYSSKANRFLSTFINLFRPIPPLAWIPLILAWFGIASLATIINISVHNPSYFTLNAIKITMLFVIFIGAFFPILSNTIHGIRSVKKTLIDSALVMGSSKKDIFAKVLLPGTMPSIVTGLRVGLGTAWMNLICAEMLPGSAAGLGYMITHAYQVTRIDVVISGIFTIMIIGFLIDIIFNIFTKNRFKWVALER